VEEAGLSGGARRGRRGRELVVCAVWREGGASVLRVGERSLAQDGRRDSVVQGVDGRYAGSDIGMILRDDATTTSCKLARPAAVALRRGVGGGGMVRVAFARG